MRGLREFNKTYKDSSFRYKLSELRWQLKYAWQRAWRGYDDVEVFNLDTEFLQRMLLILKDYRKNNVCLFSHGKYEEGKILTEEETNAVIDEMILHLENCNRDNWTDYFTLHKLTGEEKEKVFKQISHYEFLADLHKEEFLRLFIKWFDDLWY